MYIGLFQRPIVLEVTDYRKSTYTTEHEDFLFHNVKRNTFVNSYWHGESVPKMTDNMHK